MNIFDVIKSNDYLILDTETTGLGHDAEICSIAIIDSNANVLMDTLVKPMRPIPEDATRIHGITNETVQDAPLFSSLEQQVYDLLKNRHVIIYNSKYDVQMLNQSNRVRPSVTDDWNRVAMYWCAMEAFAEIYGDWNDYRHSYRWQKLEVAAGYYKVKATEAHTALGDCLTTLAVCKAMVASEAVK